MKVRAESFRAKISDQLFGRGLELGPGQIQFPTPNADSVILVDKLPSKEHVELFPELGSDVYIVEPDILLDFDADGLKVLEESSFDFVIASHLLEHLAQPFKMLDEIWRVLKPNGVAVIFLPDRRRTFDRKRICQSFEHFYDEYQNSSYEVNVDDLRDYLLKVENYSLVKLDNDLVKFHLARSIHVHAWTDKEFIRIFSQMQRFSKYNFEIIQAVDSSRNKNFEEFGFVVRKKMLTTSEQSSNTLEYEWLSALRKSGKNPLRRLLQKL